jgi:hypothetical protein
MWFMNRRLPYISYGVTLKFFVLLEKKDTRKKELLQPP